MHIPPFEIKNIVDNLKDFNYDFEGKTILLCGGSGFLGNIFKSYFIYLNNFLFINPCKVISVDNYITGTCPKDIEGTGVTNINHNLIQPLGLKIGADENIDFIINCSGLASPSGYAKFPLETLDISYIGSRNLLELAYYKKSKILFFSSSEIYGTPPDELVPTPESYFGLIDSYGKRAPYDVGKKVIETLCWTFNNKYGVDTKVVRPFNVIGYMSQNDYRVLPNYVSAALKGEKIKVYGDGKQTRTFCWFTDFVTGAILTLLKGGNHPYNIGNSDNEISMYDFAKLVESVCGQSGIVELVPAPETYSNEPRRRCPDISKAINELGYNPTVSIREGLNRFLPWAKENYS